MKKPTVSCVECNRDIPFKIKILLIIVMIVMVIYVIIVIKIMIINIQIMIKMIKIIWISIIKCKLPGFKSRLNRQYLFIYENMLLFYKII